MTRWTIVFGCVLTLALAIPFVNEAAADGMDRPISYRHKKCIAPPMLWRPGTTWICRASEKCCYDRVLRKGNCIAASDRCF